MYKNQMTMSKSGKSNVIRIIILLIITHIKKIETLSEPSNSYLRNVVNELQLLNEIDSMPDNPTSNHKNLKYFMEPQIIDRQITEIPKYNFPKQIKSKNLNDLNNIGAQDSVLLGFTSSELASMYKRAVEQGSVLKYNAFLNLVNKNIPRVTSNSYDLTEINQPYIEEPSQYTYYYYPLQSFRHQLVNYETRPGVDTKYDSTATASTNNKKEMSSMNPIFMGISSFLGIALFFFIGIFLYPRLVYYFQFPVITTSRTAFKDLSELSSLVADSIDYYNKKQSLITTFTKKIK